MSPGLDRILHPGDALVVISALPGLRKVESGRLEAPSSWGWEFEQIGLLPRCYWRDT